MAVNTSATGGYLTPAAPALEDDALEDFLHDVIAGITGIANDLVRPRWQPEPPDIPERGQYWCAFGIPMQKADFQPYLRHDPGDDIEDGTDILERHENLDVLCSFYGPNTTARLYAEYWRDGLQIPQNNEQLSMAKWGLIETGDIIPVPTLVKDKWLYRSDITVRFRRLITNVYPVLNLLSARVILITDEPETTQTLEVTDPPTP